MGNSLSSLQSRPIHLNVAGLSCKNYDRFLPGGMIWNYSYVLSGLNDIKNINHSSFLLTRECKYEDVFESDNTAFKGKKIFGSLKLGNEYLSIAEISKTDFIPSNRFNSILDYKVPSFDAIESEKTNFFIDIKDNNVCNVYYADTKKYYLCVDDSKKLVFVKEDILSFDDNYNLPQDFTYLLSNDDLNLILFKNYETVGYNITKKNNELVAILVTDDNISTYKSSPFKITKKVYNNSKINLNDTSIVYNINNTIDTNKISMGLTNNFLLHSPEKNPNYDILVLKNQLSEQNNFVYGNNLLSSSDLSESLNNGYREYCSISQSVNDLKNDLAINYVAYNKEIYIKSGYNEFVSPSSIYPYQKLNINDTKFIRQGAFSYLTPEYSDKVYNLSNYKKNKDSGQYLLCTWLSGNPYSNDKIWMDRYYYPDKISKDDAIKSIDMFNPTYDDYIEELIENNENLQSVTNKLHFFDKISDLCIEANSIYAYERIGKDSFQQPTNINVGNGVNYFKKLNETGEFTVGFSFLSDNTTWTVQSDRNDIDCGLTIVKSKNNVSIKYNLYDISTNTFEEFSTSFDLDQNTLNFILVSVNSKTGLGYFCINNQIIKEFDLQIYNYTNKKLLYGDFFLFSNGNKSNIVFSDEKILKNIILLDNYTVKELTIILSIFNTNFTIDDMIITIPSGMSNRIDEIDVLNTVYSSQFKSNYFDLNIKNTNINSETVATDLLNHITNNDIIKMPVNNVLRDINLSNHK